MVSHPNATIRRAEPVGTRSICPSLHPTANHARGDRGQTQSQTDADAVQSVVRLAIQKASGAGAFSCRVIWLKIAPEHSDLVVAIFLFDNLHVQITCRQPAAQHLPDGPIGTREALCKPQPHPNRGEDQDDRKTDIQIRPILKQNAATLSSSNCVIEVRGFVGSRPAGAKDLRPSTSRLT